jgi:hypothetical protein
VLVTKGQPGTLATRERILFQAQVLLSSCVAFPPGFRSAAPWRPERFLARRYPPIGFSAMMGTNAQKGSGA